MVDNIKSIFFLKIIFDFTEERKKLEMVKYNKNLQNKININILNYKILSGKYTIYGQNGNVKEYNSYNDQLMYEGGYINGKKNGEGKIYYYSGTVMYEGEFKDGKRHGKGKEYNYDENLKFEGEYKEGKINGKGK